MALMVTASMTQCAYWSAEAVVERYPFREPHDPSGGAARCRIAATLCLVATEPSVARAAGRMPEEAQPVTTASLAIKEARAAATIKVRVNRPYRVIHGGKVFLEGQVLTVPDDDEHSCWLTAGWVTKVKGK
jgi:hypothetical protein